MNKKRFVPVTRQSGFRDLPDADVRKEEYILDTVSSVFDSYGFERLQLPIIEQMSVLTGKGGDDVEKQMYVGKGDKWAARFDLTVQTVDYVAKNIGELPDPFKRQQSGYVLRGESAQANRLNYFLQSDIDTFSKKYNPLAPVEIIAGMCDVFDKFKSISATVYVNDRRIMNGLTEIVGLESGSKEALDLLRQIDKIDKLGKEEVLKVVGEKFGQDAVKIVDKYLNVSGDYREKLDGLDQFLGSNSTAKAGIDNLRFVCETLSEAGYKIGEGGVEVDPGIARGLGYYDGTVFEAKADEYKNVGSLFSGGEYNGLTKQMGGPDMFAVGASVGVSRLMGVLEKTGEFDNLNSYLDATVLAFPDQKPGELLGLARSLRKSGVATVITNRTDRGIGKQIQDAVKADSRFVVMQGSDEKAKGEVTIKDLSTSEQFNVKREDMAEFLKKKLGR